MNYNVIGPDGAVYGPVDVDGLKKWAAEGRITTTTVLEEIGSGRRIIANTVPGVFGPGAASSPFHAGYDTPTQTAQRPNAGPGAGLGAGPGPGASFGSQQAAYPRGVPVGPVPNNLAKAIFSTICCCLPLGVVSIVYAAQVNSKLSVGDVYGAQESAANADKYANISIGIGIVVAIIRVAMMFLSMGSHFGR